MYYYDPRLRKEGDEYQIDIYRYFLGKRKFLIGLYDKDYKKLLTYTHNLVFALNHRKGWKRIKDMFLMKNLSEHQKEK